MSHNFYTVTGYQHIYYLNPVKFSNYIDNHFVFIQIYCFLIFGTVRHIYNCVIFICITGCTLTTEKIHPAFTFFQKTDLYRILVVDKMIFVGCIDSLRRSLYHRVVHLCILTDCLDS